jgi:uncharacterized protein (DUF934 family)
MGNVTKVIFRGQVVNDEWTLVQYPVKEGPVRKQAGKPVLFRITGEQAATAEEVAALDVPTGKVIVPLLVWLARKDELTPRLNAGALGVWLDSFESLEALAESIDNLNRFALIAVNFPRFVDGRGYSYGTLLRKRFAYQGELRAIGDVFKDQLFYLKRCGFDAFAVRADKNIEDALRGLNDFSETYQAAVDQPLPLYRRYTRTAVNN